MPRSIPCIIAQAAWMMTQEQQQLLAVLSLPSVIMSWLCAQLEGPKHCLFPVVHKARGLVCGHGTYPFRVLDTVTQFLCIKCASNFMKLQLGKWNSTSSHDAHAVLFSGTLCTQTSRACTAL